MRALEPDQSGTLPVRGFEIAYETFGNPDHPAILFFPSWQIVHSRIWKMQVPYFSRFFHVITLDIPGNGHAERSLDSAAYEIDRIVDYGVGLLDHLGIDQAHVVGLSMGGAFSLWMAARFPERVMSVVTIGTSLAERACRRNPDFWTIRDVYQGWQKLNGHYWRADFEGWLDHFFSHVCTEPHSTKQFDDFSSWGRETNAEVLMRATNNEDLKPELSYDQMIELIQCPVLLIHGTDDQIVSVEVSRQIADARPDFQYVEMLDSGHAPNARDPVKTNELIADFLGRPQPLRRTWQRSLAREPKRALFLSSPIGLGHIPRDLAIADALRKLVPGLQIDWLATHPITAVLEQAGETIHPLSRELSNKTSHWESMASDFGLHCFYAFREMDEIMVNNFMVFLDAVRETPYDLWIGDEAWEVDHFLHENPELKTAPFVFMTDFVGYLPMDRSEDSREAYLTADYNAEIIEHIERYPWVRDRSLYIGEFDDIVPDRFGPGLPKIRDWVEEHFLATGYVLTFDPSRYSDKRAVRERLGYDPDQPLVVAAVGGTAAGRDLLQKVVNAWPHVRQNIPDARGVVVAGPRIDPESLQSHPGLELRPYVDRLYEHFAAADLGIVQGGLTTTMELVANRTPFLYFPLANHFEQQFHVAHRLDRYRAGRRLDFHQTTPEQLATEMIHHVGSDTSSYRPVDCSGAERAAREIAGLLTR